MEVLPPCQSSTRLGALVSPRTCPAAVADKCNGSDVLSECQQEVKDLDTGCAQHAIGLTLVYTYLKLV